MHSVKPLPSPLSPLPSPLSPLPSPLSPLPSPLSPLPSPLSPLPSPLSPLPSPLSPLPSPLSPLPSPLSPLPLSLSPSLPLSLGLSTLQLEFDYTGASLNIWDPPVLQMAGVWSPPTKMYSRERSKGNKQHMYIMLSWQLQLNVHLEGLNCYYNKHSDSTQNNMDKMFLQPHIHMVTWFKV